MKVLSSDQARSIDSRSSTQYSIPSGTLMENAGKKSFTIISSQYSAYMDKSVLIVCGGGNNGGDGAVLARYMAQNKVRVTVCYLCDMESASGDKAQNYQLLKSQDLTLIHCLNIEEWQKFIQDSGPFDVVIDAIFGIGFHGCLDDFHGLVVADINRIPLVISLDIASGLNADTQTVEDSVQAHATVTFGAPKLCQVDYPGKSRTGRLFVADIGFPAPLMEDESLNIMLVQKSDVAQHLIKRPAYSHKGDYGHVLIIGGQTGMTGAVVHAGQAAYRSGAGLVTVSAQSGQEALFAPFPELMLLLHDSPEQIMDFIGEKNIQTILMGCGWGRGPEQESLLGSILEYAPAHLILDADALNIIAEKDILKEALKQCPSSKVLTPHLKEFSRLTGRTVEEIRSNKVRASQEFCRDYDCVLILKDSVSMTCDKNDIWYNSTGNDTLAKGGSGDILAGIGAGLMASGHSGLEAGKIASYVLGLCADRYASLYSSRSALPGDILSLIPESFKILESNR